MASLCRFHNLSAVRRILPVSANLRNVQVCRLISTSDKKQDGSAVKAPDTSRLPDIPKTWTSWGFDQDNYEKDRFIAHMMFFGGVTCCLIGTAFIMLYYPDMNQHDWYQREAYLQLRQREAAGLPLIDPNYIPASQIKLPSDEELGEYEIII